jgi:hypothetical protein
MKKDTERLKKGYYIHNDNGNLVFIKIVKFMRICNTGKQEYSVRYPRLDARLLTIYVDNTNIHTFKRIGLMDRLKVQSKQKSYKVRYNSIDSRYTDFLSYLFNK